MASDQPAITTQPANDGTNVSQESPRVPPTSTTANCKGSASQVSYADSDEHAEQFYCGCMRCCKACCSEGSDKRWYYPWDKGPLCCLPLGCGWCCVGLLFPCSLCIPSCRNIICMVEEGAWDGTCFGACICGIPRDSTGRRRDSDDSDY